MTKAKEIVGLDCAANALEGIAKVLHARLDEVVSFRDAALDFSDIEGVHDMRVATRRLRSALRDFTPLLNKRPVKKLTKELSRLADALGAVRDHDVMILAIKEMETKAKSEAVKEGIEIFLRERRGLREAARRNLTEILEAGNIDNLQKQFKAAIDKAASQNKSKHTVSFSEAGRVVITAGLEDLLDLGAGIYEPFNATALHKLRLAAKHLRYSSTLFVVCWGEALIPVVREISRMQSCLGELHDGDVWIEILSKRLQQRKWMNESDFQASAWLLSEFVNKRTKEYRSALGLWSKWEATDFAGRLRAVIA